ncbi:MAG: tyrosine-type recombinase/integrase, partial [Fibrobacteria bacterium]|nr:tyrosine-type recombinase/integrase [Fibrobacteria bacterium]
MKTITEFIDDYLDYLRSLNFSKATINGRRCLLIRFNKYLFDTWQLEFIEKLGSDMLRQWHRQLSDLRSREGYPIKATGINRHIIAVRGFLKYLADMGYIQKRIIDTLPYLKEPKVLPQSVLTHSQMRHLLSKIPKDSPANYRNRAMLELMYSTGIRAGEIIGLNLSDIDIKNRTAKVLGKGNKERMVPIGRTAMRHLETWIKAVRPYLEKDSNEQALFLTRIGTRPSYSAFNRAVASAVKHSGLDKSISP